MNNRKFCKTCKAHMTCACACMMSVPPVAHNTSFKSRSNSSCWAKRSGRARSELPGFGMYGIFAPSIKEGCPRP